MLLISETLKKIFTACESINSSDIHISCGEVPRFRMDGNLMPNPLFTNFDSETVDDIAMELGLETLPIGCADGTERIRLTLLKEGSIDGAISSPSGTRYRFNIFRENSRTAIAMRRLDSTFHSLSTLGLPEKLEEFCYCPDGLVIVTGPTGSGKSTTLATLIETINSTRHSHIVTIEDPIEFIHTSKKSLVHQRQIGRDAKNFSSALVESLRQDPDVILVGEIRDLATFRTALTASETGHLVFATLHAGDCVGAIERFISVFPSDEQNGIRQQLALSLRGVLAQHLLPSKKGGRVAVCELMVNTVATANLIATARTAQLLSVIETSGNIGMQSMDQSLAKLVLQNRISEAAAYTLSKSPETLKSRLATSRV
ncbi:MAG: PilT/PilU family type 4a pilus ATPase [Kiritimatiellae bacterium]|nr:PilT/PilU family type 4a pilus ATPase [Kiritimatiellia bacterium]